MKIFGQSLNRLFFFCGPCVIESEDFALRTADKIAQIGERTGALIVYKSSFDKANRTSRESFRGVGIDKGLEILAKVKAWTGLPVITDVHEIDQIEAVAQVADVLQTPALLCRQTDFIQKVAAAGKPVNIKKGQWMAPRDMANVIDKCEAVGNKSTMICERGTAFGYNNLVVDMRGIPIMQETGRPVVFDATHSTQLPSSQGTSSGGERRFVPTLAKAAVAAGANGVFMESHPDPDNALCDGPNSWPLDRLEELIEDLINLGDNVSRQGSGR